jgi:PmbA protein
MTDQIDFLQNLIRTAQKQGAEAADAAFSRSDWVSVGLRLGQLEKLERAEDVSLSLRVFIGKQQASVSTGDLKKDSIDRLVERAVAMARVVPEDPYCGIAPQDLVCTSWPDLDLNDSTDPTVETLIARASEAEATAHLVPGVTNTESVEAGWGRTHTAIAASNGFAGQNVSSRHSLSLAVLAGPEGAREVDYDSNQAIYGADLTDAKILGARAGERAARRVGAQKLASSTLPVVFAPRVAGSLLGHLVGAISGPSIARGTSFLKDKLGQAIFAPGITIIDAPHRLRGLRSRPFDGEGLAPSERNIIDQGRLTGWILDLRSARQLGLAPTGQGGRGGPSPSNLYLQPATNAPSPEDLIADIKDGFYVTELMGSGVNPVTGDYSRGAAGFRIENGQLTHPVSEVTIAGSLPEMFKRLQTASDLTFQFGIDSPTLRIDDMVVAGT